MEPASGLRRGSLASISFKTLTAAENFGSILAKSGLNESQMDRISFACLLEFGFVVTLFMASMSPLEWTGVLVIIV